MVSMSHFSNHHESDAVLGRDPDDWANRGPQGVKITRICG